MVILSYYSILMVVSLLSVFIYIINAYYCFLLRPRNKQSILFICINAAMLIWSFAFMLFFNSSYEDSAILWFRAAAIGFCTYYAFALHFTLLVCFKDFSFLRKVTLGLIYFSCIPFIILFFTKDLSFMTFYQSRGLWFYSINLLEPWYTLYLIVSVVPLIITLYYCFNCMQKAASHKIKKKYIIIFITQFLSLVLGITTNVIFPLLHQSIVPPFANIIITFYTLGLRYLIKNHNLISLTPAIAADHIISKVIDMIALTDPDDIIIEINESLKSTLDYTDKDLLGKKIDSIFLNTDLFTQGGLNTLDSNIIGFNIISKLNTRIPVKLSISKICDENDTLLGNVYVFQDMRLIAQLREEIYEKESLEGSLIKTYEQLKDLDKLKSDFLCNVSHELRTPLNLMLSSLKLSLSKFDDFDRALDTANVYKLFDTMNQNCYRLTKVINNIIDITKIDADYFKLNLSNYNIVNIIEEITLAAAAYVKNKDITFLFDTEIEELVIACDAERIERIMLNLISNAVKFTDAGGEIFVNISLRGKNILISVKDTGIGISYDKQQLIFERFTRVDRSLSRSQEGSGIGLSLAKLLVELHQGTISVKSEPNIGSTFTIALPIYIINEGGACIIPQFDHANNISEKINIEFSDVYL